MTPEWSASVILDVASQTIADHAAVRRPQRDAPGSHSSGPSSTSSTSASTRVSGSAEPRGGVNKCPLPTPLKYSCRPTLTSKAPPPQRRSNRPSRNRRTAGGDGVDPSRPQSAAQPQGRHRPDHPGGVLPDALLAPVIAPGNPALITSLWGATSLPGTSVWHHTQGTRRLRPHRVGFPQLAIRRIHRRPGRHRDRNAGRSGLRFFGRRVDNSLSLGGCDR